ncbi:MAG: oxygen-independent coproporphyrinogen-3 oxidase [Lentisphaeria bacterium]|jgi:oxygen-independent coproporphyrinogen-3 oxidase
MTRVMAKTSECFNLLGNDECEYSIEIHPAGVSAQRISRLRELGFNRLSMGIQNFEPSVQQAVNRFNSLAEVERLMVAIRGDNFRSVSIDLTYGLPRQTAESFARTLQYVIDLSPDRLSLFNYAHMPHLFKTQKQINANELPEPQEKLTILNQSVDQLLSFGYVYIAGLWTDF